MLGTWGLYLEPEGGLPLFTLLPRRRVLGNRMRIFVRRYIKVPAPKVRDRGERAPSPGPNA
jgi:hypothetical protein